MKGLTAALTLGAAGRTVLVGAARYEARGCETGGADAAARYEARGCEQLAMKQGVEARGCEQLAVKQGVEARGCVQHVSRWPTIGD